jgi:hypothetical protein
MTETFDPLECVPWTGLEKDTPAGVNGLPADVFITDLITAVVVIDTTKPEGIAEIPYENVKHDMKIINVKLNEGAINAIDPEGRIIKIVDPDTQKGLTRREWFDTPALDGEPRRTDGLAMWAAVRVNLKARGGGIKTTNPNR